MQFPNEKHLFPRPPPPTPQNDKVPLLEKSKEREGLLAQERDRKPGKMEAVSLAAAEGLIRRGRDTLPTPPQVHYPLSFLHIPPFTGLVIWSPLVKEQKSLLFPAISWAPIVPFIPGDCTKIPSFLKMPFPINFFSLFLKSCSSTGVCGDRPPFAAILLYQFLRRRSGAGPPAAQEAPVGRPHLPGQVSCARRQAQRPCRHLVARGEAGERVQLHTERPNCHHGTMRQQCGSLSPSASIGGGRNGPDNYLSLSSLAQG